MTVKLNQDTTSNFRIYYMVTIFNRQLSILVYNQQLIAYMWRLFSSTIQTAKRWFLTIFTWLQQSTFTATSAWLIIHRTLLLHKMHHSKLFSKSSNYLHSYCQHSTSIQLKTENVQTKHNHGKKFNLNLFEKPTSRDL